MGLLAACRRFFLHDAANTDIYTLSLHDALPISLPEVLAHGLRPLRQHILDEASGGDLYLVRSEEHTSELQSHSDLVCRLLLEKKNELARISLLRTHVMRHAKPECQAFIRIVR